MNQPQIDEALREFFHKEMPNPWPSWQRPPAPVSPPGRHVWRSRLALAASVALLLLSHWTLTTYFLDGPASAGSNSLNLREATHRNATGALPKAASQSSPR